MKKRILKKSDVLREGYVNGLKHAQRIINEVALDDEEDWTDEEDLDGEEDLYDEEDWNDEEDVNTELPDEEYRTYRVEMERTVKSYVVLRATSEEDAEEKVQIGISVNEDGTLDARSDYEEDVISYDAESSYDDILNVQEEEE